MARAHRAAVYCRISRDPEGLKVGVERQTEDCRTLAGKEGCAVSMVFIDNDLSASTLSRRPRPQYIDMLQLARRGEIDVIISYSNSRLTRRPLEYEELIQLNASHGTRIVTVVSGEDDLSTADGRMVGRIKASVDASEAERASERIRRALLQRSRTGATNSGGRPFGWAADKLTSHPVEADLVRTAARQTLDGVTLRAIARDWNDRGIKTSRGKPWSHTTLRRLLQRPRLAGWQTRHKELVVGLDGQQVRGEWEPLLDQDTFDRLQVQLSRDGRGGARRGSRIYLLAGMMRCGTCGRRMYGSNTRKDGDTWAYTCHREPYDHSLAILGRPTEEAVIAAVRERMEQTDLTSLPDPEPEKFPSDTRLAQIPTMIKDLMAAYNEGRLSSNVVFSQVEQLEAEQQELSWQRSRYIEVTAGPTDVSVADLDHLDTDRKRAALETIIEAIVIAPAGRRGAPWDFGRITVVWKQG